MNRHEVKPADHVAPVVLVLERSVNGVMDAHCTGKWRKVRDRERGQRWRRLTLENDEEEEGEGEQGDVLVLVEDRKGANGGGEGQAKPAEGKPYLEQQAVHVVLVWLATGPRQASQHEDGLEDEDTEPAGRLHGALHLHWYQGQADAGVFRIDGLEVEKAQRLDFFIPLKEAEDHQLKEEADQVGDGVDLHPLLRQDFHVLHRQQLSP